MTDAHHLLAAGNLTMAAVCVNSARLNNAEGLTASEQEQLSAIQQVIEQASSSLRAGRDLFTREDGSSTRDLLPEPPRRDRELRTAPGIFGDDCFLHEESFFPTTDMPATGLEPDDA